MRLLINSSVKGWARLLGSPAHKRLDGAVFAAYGWNPDLSDEELLEKSLSLNLERSMGESSR